MKRTLRVSLRPTIALGIIFGGISIWIASGYFANGGHQLDQLESAAMLMGMYALLLAQIYSVRISVNDRGLMLRRWYVTTQEIPFDEITHSDVQYLAERDWPVRLTIHRKGELSSITLGMKAVQQQDACWLCSLPQLKVVVHPGLTTKP